MSAPLEPAARLYDVRYSRYTGGHEPRRRAVQALAASTAGRALGLRRSAGAKVWPFLLVSAAYLPVVVVVGLPLLLDEVFASPLDLLGYAQLQGVLLPVVVAFAATTLPSLLTRERRDRVLSLYFSTAVSPAEYLIGKVLAAVGLVLLVALGPLVALFAGTVLTSDAPLEQLRELAGDLPGVLAAGTVVALHYAALGLAAGALTAKRVFAVGGLLAALLVTPVVSQLAYGLTDQPRWLGLDLALAPFYAAASVLPGVPDEQPAPPDALAWGVCAAVALLSATVLLVRYVRRADDA